MSWPYISCYNSGLSTRVGAIRLLLKGYSAAAVKLGTLLISGVSVAPLTGLPGIAKGDGDGALLGPCDDELRLSGVGSDAATGGCGQGTPSSPG